MNVANRRFPLFDSLRAVAALTVLGFHAGGPNGLDIFSGENVGPYLIQLDVGIVIFFLISGFLLYRPFVQTRYDGDPSPLLRAYALRRALRIFPAYWLALPVVALVLGLSYVFTVSGLPYWLLLQAYDSSKIIGGISQAWTLSVELSFYAALPLWALAVRRLPARSPRAFLATELVPLAALFAFSVAWKHYEIQTVEGAFFEPSWHTFTLPAFADSFALGMGLAVLSVALSARDRPTAAERLIDRLPSLAWVLAAVAYWASVEHVCPSGRFQANAFGECHAMRELVAVGLLLPAIFGDPARGLVRRFLGWRPILWIGLVSYGIYLWHLMVIRELSDNRVQDAVGTVGFVALTVALSTAAAAVSFYGLERRALRLGRRVSGRAGVEETAGTGPSADLVDGRAAEPDRSRD